MGARDSFTTFRPRGLSTEDAQLYLGVKRRTFDVLKSQLNPVRLGTSLVYDVRELDELFDRLKRTPALEAEQEQSINQTPATMEAQSSPDRRPSEKGVSKWVVKQASTTRTPKEGGESTESTVVRDFKAALAHMRTQKPG